MKTTLLAKRLNKLSKEMDIQFNTLFSLTGEFKMESMFVFNPDDFDYSEAIGIDSERCVMIKDAYSGIITRFPFDSFTVDDKISILIEMEEYFKNKNV